MQYKSIYYIKTGAHLLSVQEPDSKHKTRFLSQNAENENEKAVSKAYHNSNGHIH